jgi:hypothetical protein
MNQTRKRRRGQGWRSLKLVTISRAVAAGWSWTDAPKGKALRSPRGTIYELRMLPLAARRYREVRLPDAA